ncbi:MAG: hypothetical protein WD030_06150 [Pirellulales bacterium]
MKRLPLCLLPAATLALLTVAPAPAADPPPRNQAHVEYAQTLWDFLNRPGANYRSWTPTETVLVMPYGPAADANSKTYQNRVASESPSLPVGSIIVTEHLHGEDVVGVSVWYRQADGYDAANGDWYWAYFTPQGKLAQASGDNSPYAKRGFVTVEEDGRLWVLKIGTPELADFFKDGELAKHVVRPGAGPGGRTIKAPDAETIDEYLTAKSGFVTLIEDGRLWVFHESSEELADFTSQGELAKHVIRPGAGPGGMTIKAPDAETLDEYLLAKPGFMTKVEDGRLWVIALGSEEEAAFKKDGELAKHVIQPAAGPNGMTIKAPDAETIAKYMASAEGFHVVLEDGRVWVFKSGSPEYTQFKQDGEPAKSVTRPGAGPRGVTLRAVDAETLDAYQRAVN